jgi:hypothetical protein
MRETSANELLTTHRNSSDDIETGVRLCSGKSMAATYLRAMWCPVYRRRDPHSGFRAELEILAVDEKGKGTGGSSARPNVPMRPSGADCSIVALRRGNSRGAKGVGHPPRDRKGSTGNRRNSLILGDRRQPSMGGTSRISREAYVRICERLGVRFPGATRRQCWRATRSRNSRPELIADDERSVVLPTRSFTWARGRPAGGGTVPPQGLVLVVWTTSDR